MSPGEYRLTILTQLLLDPVYRAPLLRELCLSVEAVFMSSCLKPRMSAQGLLAGEK